MQFICHRWNINSCLVHELSEEVGCHPSISYKPAWELEREQGMFIISADNGGGASEPPCDINCFVRCFDPASMKLRLDCEGFGHLHPEQYWAVVTESSFLRGGYVATMGTYVECSFAVAVIWIWCSDFSAVCSCIKRKWLLLLVVNKFMF